MPSRKAVLVLLTVLVYGCSSSGPAQHIQYGSERVRYSFSESAMGWDTFTIEGEQALFRVRAGALEGASVADLGYIWTLNNQRHGNVAIQAKVQQVQGANGNGFGLMCRADRRGNGYYFLISSAGTFTISKGTDAQNDLIALVAWTPHPAIRRGNEQNELVAVCAGDYLAFFANGTFLAETRDTDFSAGQAGLVLGAVRETLWVRFDDVIIRDVVVVGAG